MKSQDMLTRIESKVERKRSENVENIQEVILSKGIGVVKAL